MAEPEVVLSVITGTEWIRMRAEPLMSIVVALGAVICILVTLKIIFTKEPQVRKRAEEALKDVISVIMVLVLVISAINIMAALRSDRLNREKQETINHIRVMDKTNYGERVWRDEI